MCWKLGSVIQSVVAALTMSLLAILAGCGGGDGTAEAAGGTESLAAGASASSYALGEVPAQGPSVIAMTKVSETRVSRTVFEYVFRITVRNDAIDRKAVVAELVSTGAGTVIVKGAVAAGDLAPGQEVTPEDTITLRHDRTQPFDPAATRWSIATLGTLADLKLKSAALDDSSSGNSYAVEGIDYAAAVVFVPEANFSGASLRVSVAAGPGVAAWNEAKKLWVFGIQGKSIKSGSNLEVKLRVLSPNDGRYAMIPVKVNIVSPSFQTTGIVSPKDGLTLNGSDGLPLVISASNLKSQVSATLTEAVFPSGVVRTIVAFDKDVSTSGLSIEFPELGASRVAGPLAESNGNLSRSRALSPTRTAVRAIGLSQGDLDSIEPYKNSNDSLGNQWLWFYANVNDQKQRIPAKTKISLKDLCKSTFTGVLISDEPCSRTEFTWAKWEVSSLHSVVSQTTDLQASEAVIFVNGYSLVAFCDTGSSCQGGGKGTWGEFPRLVLQSSLFGGKQLIPFEFRWMTNSRFASAADDLAAAINEIKKNTGVKKVHLVAHSFGGLVVRAFLQGHTLFTTEPDKSSAIDSISSVLTLGTPHSGISPKIDEFLPHGQDIAGIMAVCERDNAPSSCMNMCRQLSCFEAGVDVVGLPNSLYPSSGGGLSPGFLVKALAKGSPAKRQIPFVVGIGIRADSTGVLAGDMLISRDGQRFVPNWLAGNALLDDVEKSSGFKVQERILGALAEREIPTSAEKLTQLFGTRRGLGYVHQAILPRLLFEVPDGAPLPPEFGGGSKGYGLEAYINGGCTTSDKLEDCEHSSLKLLRELLTDASPPSRTAWDAVADFSLSTSANTPWQYRFDDPSNEPQLMGSTISNCSDLRMTCWKVSPTAIDLPFVAINNSGATISTRTIVVPTGMLVLHPGFVQPYGNAQRPVVSWIAPEAGTYNFYGRFEIVDTIPTGVRIIVKQDDQTLMDSRLNGYGSKLPISFTRALAKGQAVSFTLDADSNHSNDSTGMVLTVTKQSSQPEPAPSAMLFDDQFTDPTLSKWTQMTAYSNCCGAGRAANLSLDRSYVADTAPTDGSYLKIDMSGGSCGSCGVPDGSFLFPKMNAVTGDFVAQARIIELWRQPLGQGLNSIVSVGMLLNHTPGSTVFASVGSSGDGTPWNLDNGGVAPSYSIYGVFSGVPPATMTRIELPAQTYHVLDLQFERTGGTAYLRVKIDNEPTWREVGRAPVASTVPITPSLSVTSGHWVGWPTSANGGGRFLVDYFKVYRR